jgi:2-phosphoglycolate phosphatase
MSLKSLKDSPRIRLVIFDLDGTLIDSAKDIAESVNTLRKRMGQPPLTQKRVIAGIGQGVRHLLKKTVPPRILASHPTAAADFRKIYLDRSTRFTKLFPGGRLLLKGLHKRGIRLAVASNKPSILSGKILRNLGIRRYFSAVLCGDSVKNPKPHPESINTIMKRFRIPPRETLMVGDSRFDMEAGQRAGTLLAATTFGFGSRKELKRFRPDFWLNHLERLLKLI